MRKRGSSALGRLATRAGAVLDGAAVSLLRAAATRAPRPARPRPVDDSASRRTHEAGLADEGPRARLEALAAIYGRPEHFTDPESFFRTPPPAQVQARHREDLAAGIAMVNLEYASTYEPFHAAYRDEHLAHVENRTVHARWFRSRRPRPTVICLHGMGGGDFFFEEKAFVARYWLRCGLDVVLFQLPFHGHRRPTGVPRRTTLFPSMHVARTNESFAQAVHDLRALMAWLRAGDVPTLGLLGMSLGGYTTALTASVSSDVDFAVPMIPAVTMDNLMWRHGAETPARARAEAAGVTREHLAKAFRVHAPLERTPLVAPERRFLIAGRGDRITPPEQAEALWEHWGRPPIHWFPGGHLAQVGRGDAFRALRRWLSGPAGVIELDDRGDAC